MGLKLLCSSPVGLGQFPAAPFGLSPEKPTFYSTDLGAVQFISSPGWSESNNKAGRHVQAEEEFPSHLNTTLTGLSYMPELVLPLLHPMQPWHSILEISLDPHSLLFDFAFLLLFNLKLTPMSVIWRSPLKVNLAFREDFVLGTCHSSCQ